jgi:quercetin dioxygenase-like cupin family protein
MKKTVHRWERVAAAVFQLNTGEKIERHSHMHEHTTAVIRGSTRVSVWFPDGLLDFEMAPDDGYATMPADIEHEIEAMADDTIVINMEMPAPPALKGQDGGITFHD